MCSRRACAGRRDYSLLRPSLLAPIFPVPTPFPATIADAVADLGKSEEIGDVFADNLTYLYHPQIQTGLQQLENRVQCAGQVVGDIVMAAH